MARTTKPTYTIEFPLHLPTWQEHRLEKKFKIARMVYNSCLGEALKRHKAVKSDKAYRKLLKEPKSKERDKKLVAIRLNYSFSEYDIHHFVTSVQKSLKRTLEVLKHKNLRLELLMRLRNFILINQKKCTSKKPSMILQLRINQIKQV